MIFNKKQEKNKRDTLNLYITDIVAQLQKYNILSIFSSKDELDTWLLDLNDLEVHNILSLDVDPDSIKFDLELLINRNLLNTLDYNKRVETLASIKNAEGWYHLFDVMLREEFLNSDRFYQDIETLKRAECAQTSLWIIGDSTFINSPYHEEDFQLLVTSKDNSGRGFDYVVWDAIATVASSYDSIISEYHRQDLQTIVKYGSKALQMSHTYPQGSINCLAVDPVSLNDRYHLENMEILANNKEIGNFLYAVMTHPKAIKKDNYRRIIREMVNNKNNISYVFLVCYYAIGEKAAVDAQNALEHNYFYDIKSHYDIKELLEKVDERINVIDRESEEVTVYEIGCNDSVNQPTSNNLQKKIRRFFKRK